MAMTVSACVGRCSRRRRFAWIRAVSASPLAVSACGSPRHRERSAPASRLRHRVFSTARRAGSDLRIVHRRPPLRDAGRPVNGWMPVGSARIDRQYCSYPGYMPPPTMQVSISGSTSNGSSQLSIQSTSASGPSISPSSETWRATMIFLSINILLSLVTASPRRARPTPGPATATTSRPEEPRTSC
jgi:hypothetical protein